MARRSSGTAVQAPEDGQGFLPMRAPRRQPDRVGKRNIGGQVDIEVARALAILAAKQDSTQLALLEEALADLFKKYDHVV